MYDVQVFINIQGNLVIKQEREEHNRSLVEVIILHQSQGATVSKWLKDHAVHLKNLIDEGHEFGNQECSDEDAEQEEEPQQELDL